MSDEIFKDKDSAFDRNLRPKKIDDFIGQDRIKKSLNIFLKATKERQEPLEHVLFHGPPGIGKTTLAHIIGGEMESTVKVTSGPAIERVADLAAILTSLEDRDVLFIDEIHRLNHHIEEILYPAMEEGKIDLVVGKGPSAQVLRLDLPNFTLIGATTKFASLSSPLRDRFGIIYRLNFYEESDIKKIIQRSAEILGIEINQKAINELACRSRFTPRIANRLLKRLRDFAQIENQNKIDEELAKNSLDTLEIDEYGLDDLDRKILGVILEKFSGGPVGINALASAIGEDRVTLEEVYEPYLMQLGFLERTPTGRKVSHKAIEHLKNNRLNF
ncbi:MAG: Holliday junction branch migration DNA helicase RuvB [Patescibacteria group bacterium]|nr:Holliday junction branch migration DNA helicase RuvB [Patescibacteria group bacterium]